MLNILKLDKLFVFVIKNQTIELNNQQLVDIGFENEEIIELLKEKTIIQSDLNIYKYNLINRLYNQAIVFWDNKNFLLAKKCFLLCYQINPKYSNISHRLFLVAIHDKDYDNAFMYLDSLYDNRPDMLSDLNFYLYLLCFITDIPTRYRDIADKLKYSDFSIDSNNNKYNDHLTHLKIRQNANAMLFGQAHYICKDLSNHHLERHFGNLIIRILLIQASDQKDLEFDEISMLVENKQYSELIFYFDALLDKHKLQSVLLNILKVASAIINIQTTGMIPTPQNTDTSVFNIFNAIELGRFEEALALCNPNPNIAKNNYSLLFTILTDIVDLIHTLKNISESSVDNILPTK